MGIGNSSIEAQNAEKARKLRETALHMVDIQAEEQVEAYLVKSTLHSCESVSDKLYFSHVSTLISTVCHWALVFVFADFTVTIEGLNENGKLVPRYRRVPERPAGQYFSLSNPRSAMLSATYRTAGDQSNAKQMPTLANLTVSPDDLRLVALRTSRHSHKDCQTWAVDAAWSLLYLQQQRGAGDRPPTYREATSTQKTNLEEELTVETPDEWSLYQFCMHTIFYLIPRLIFISVLSVLCLGFILGSSKPKQITQKESSYFNFDIGVITQKLYRTIVP